MEKEEMKKENWIKGMDRGKEWIPHLREELLEEEHNTFLFIPILLRAVINLEKRVSEVEKCKNENNTDRQRT